ncbi:ARABIODOPSIS THALIANA LIPOXYGENASE 2, lipoxygenase 2 [Hibiscus trionum]|uniref:Lipoxygenase n=1 Tax=Hibiscus trionum TaxID=183268 RepID=A0A9W7M7V5_HIBTR|nr:ARABIODOPSIS THALIANA LIPOXYGENASE 2, lipoxygenase 2 [Hibiscus trionum]
MLKPNVYRFQTLLPLHKPFIHGSDRPLLPPPPPTARLAFGKTGRAIRISSFSTGIKATAKTEKSIRVKATVIVKETIGDFLTHIRLDRGLDVMQDLLGKSILLELVSMELNPTTGLEKDTIKAFAHRVAHKGYDIKYEAEFRVGREFGEIGAVFVENEHHREMYVDEIVIDGFPNGPVKVKCASWVHSKFENPEKRVFFVNKSYLPSKTPNGLTRLREKELASLRGNGIGERKRWERVYDYDVYNDLGDPDEDPELKRSVLGGEQFRYPRRCRTGRPRCEKDPLSENRNGHFYVPRDECFSEIKQLTFSAKTVYSLMHCLIPAVENTIADRHAPFPHITAVDSLFSDGINLPPLMEQGVWNTVLPRLFSAITDGGEDVLRFEAPHAMARDKFFWFRDEEFARQTLSGLNPHSIRLVTEWPLKSKLDPKIYGPAESAITEEMINREIGGVMKAEQALKQKRLFILDYHDLYLPYVKKIRELDGTTLYGSRALFFLNSNDTLRPLAIELTRPPMDGKPQWKQVYAPSWDSTACWLWRFAKVHVLAHDAGYHQLVSHWLRTHCVTEPYIIATNRQLSVMHPIHRLLHPHFRYTIEINALARESLINADGVIENSFSPGKYSMELCAIAYDLEWRFDHEAMPADLISRGMAEEDPNAPHGLRLTINDYPFANDGLLIWDALEQWVSDYVTHYYSNANLVESDKELQEWWNEIHTVGHADKKDQPWWPTLGTPKDLINIVTTIIWVTSGHHAAVNFGQYTYAGYFPNKPTVARTKMPSEDPSDEEWKSFVENPEATLLRCFPSQLQATKVMAVLDVLSNHSPDEEYLGEEMEPSWGEDPVIKAAFERLNGRLKEIEGIIDERNRNSNLRNRNGAGIIPYELLMPFSGPGVTGKGVPCSISI